MKKKNQKVANRFIVDELSKDSVSTARTVKKAKSDDETTAPNIEDVEAVVKIANINFASLENLRFTRSELERIILFLSNDDSVIAVKVLRDCIANHLSKERLLAICNIDKKQKILSFRHNTQIWQDLINVFKKLSIEKIQPLVSSQAYDLLLLNEDAYRYLLHHAEGLTLIGLKKCYGEKMLTAALENDAAGNTTINLLKFMDIVNVELGSEEQNTTDEQSENREERRKDLPAPQETSLNEQVVDLLRADDSFQNLHDEGSAEKLQQKTSIEMSHLEETNGMDNNEQSTVETINVPRQIAKSNDSLDEAIEQRNIDYKVSALVSAHESDEQKSEKPVLESSNFESNIDVTSTPIVENNEYLQTDSKTNNNLYSAQESHEEMALSEKIEHNDRAQEQNQMNDKELVQFSLDSGLTSEDSLVSLIKYTIEEYVNIIGKKEAIDYHKKQDAMRALLDRLVIVQHNDTIAKKLIFSQFLMVVCADYSGIGNWLRGVLGIRAIKPSKFSASTTISSILLTILNKNPILSEYFTSMVRSLNPVVAPPDIANIWTKEDLQRILDDRSVQNELQSCLK